jgi:hypothetical protein
MVNNHTHYTEMTVINTPGQETPVFTGWQLQYTLTWLHYSVKFYIEFIQINEKHQT